MRMDETSDSDDLQSKSARRRWANKILDLAGELIALSDTKLTRLPLPESIVQLIRQSRHITQRVAAKRQRQFVAKHLRELDEGTLEQLLAGETVSRNTEVKQQSYSSAWLQHLLRDGDAALFELCQLYPELDRQQLRTALRAARRAKDPATSSGASKLRSALDKLGLTQAPGSQTS